MQRAIISRTLENAAIKKRKLTPTMNCTSCVDRNAMILASSKQALHGIELRGALIDHRKMQKEGSR